MKSNKRKKIGIVSLYYRSLNLGGLLQSYALTKVLGNMGYDVEQICYDSSELSSEGKILEKKMKAALLQVVGIKKILLKAYSIIKQPFVNKRNENIQKELKVQKQKFEEFEKFIPHSKLSYNVNNIPESNEIYEIFICGSDQVWNPFLLAHKAYFLEFVQKEKKRIAYAVSTGKSYLTEVERAVFEKYIEKFEEIGVREKSLQVLLKTMNKESEVVLDPTLLVSKEEWLTVANFSAIPQEKYIFCYFLGDTAWQRKLAVKYAKDRKLKLIHLPYIMGRYRSCDKYLEGEGRYDVGPREFIALIHNAECIFTDSFHAMVFSFLFKKQFYVFNRNEESGSLSMNARITDFVEIFKLESRHVLCIDTKLDREMIDYSVCEEILLQKRSHSIDFLKKSLSE